MVTSAEHQITSDVVDIRRFFRPINYLGFNILQLQVLCQHLRSTILCARSRYLLNPVRGRTPPVGSI